MSVVRGSRRAAWSLVIAGALACAGSGGTTGGPVAERAASAGDQRAPSDEPAPSARGDDGARDVVSPAAIARDDDRDDPVEDEVRADESTGEGALARVEEVASTDEAATADDAEAALLPPLPPIPLGTDPMLADPALTTSLGGPASGALHNGFPLPESGPGFRSNPRRPNPEAFYGTVETIRALVRAAAVVDAALPGSELVINDIGFREGGPIRHHGSHQAGRDVDVLFYYLDREGNPWPAKGVPVDPHGRGWDFGDLAVSRDDVRVRLDVPRTWRFVQALIEEEDPSAPLQRIFLAEHVRTILLEHADRTRAPRAVRDRFADLTCQPSYPHDDHLHLRFFCTPEDLRAGCMDGSPMYPWRRQQLRAEELEPVMARPRPRSRARGHDGEATASAPPPRVHARVRAFLDQRALWSVQPHPGRRYCR